MEKKAAEAGKEASKQGGKEASKEVVHPARPMAFRDLLPWHWGDTKSGPTADDPFDSLQHTMNRLLESFRREIGRPGKNGDFGVVRSRMDISESDDAFEVMVELPGMDEKNVDVSVTDDALTIRGEKKTEESGKKKDYHYRECTYGSVERVVPLPDGIDSDKVAAKFKKGVLTVTIPKTAEARRQPRKIEVQS